MVVVTDGVQSYAVFTYQCGQLNWVVGNSTSIGFSASSTMFANHPLSRQSNVNDIACLNQQYSPWSNVVYKIRGSIQIHNSGYGSVSFSPILFLSLPPSLLPSPLPHSFPPSLLSSLPPFIICMITNTPEIPCLGPAPQLTNCNGTHCH